MGFFDLFTTSSPQDGKKAEFDEVRAAKEELTYAVADAQGDETTLTADDLDGVRSGIQGRDVAKEKHLISAFKATGHDYETFQQLIEGACQVIEQDEPANVEDEQAYVVGLLEDAESLVRSVSQNERYDQYRD